MINESIAHYRVTAKIGAGGMGEVYRATDTKLGRDVALKVLPEAFAQDTQRMQRFQREAQVLASLNHPGIAAIYGFEESGSTHALAMELVEGPTLAERIGQGPIPVEEALPLAKQIAEALEYAHDHGIIHRDLKPANIKLTPDGKVKILDFGLAKALAGEVSQLESLNSPTLSIAATQAGIILGTAAYMSPEQAKGKSVDRRCDIWAFGVVLFEMLTGRRLYEGETASETMAAVIMKDPAFDQLPPGLPPAIRNLLARCLRKDPKLRLQSIGDARVAIEEAANPSLAVDAATTAPPGVAPTAPAWGRVLPWALAGVLAVALGVSLWRTSSTDDAARVRPARFFFSVAENQALNLATSTAVAISPDGSKMAYTARLDGIVRLFLRPMDRLEATPIPGTENAAGPFFSPDGDWVAFFAEGRLKKVPLAGGPAVTLATEVRDNRSGTWAGNTIVYGPDAISGLFRVSADGGQPQPLTTLDEARKERTHRFPRFL
ncbi:MAG TPA: protein kinase, partial [Candidatus Acidoferrales bacterium]